MPPRQLLPVCALAMGYSCAKKKKEKKKKVFGAPSRTLCRGDLLGLHSTNSFFPKPRRSCFTISISIISIAITGNCPITSRERPSPMIPTPKQG